MKKLVYVTGAGRGIGRTIAVKLAQEGYVVSGCARTVSQLEETQKLSGGKVRIASVDVSDEKSLQKWLDQEAAATGAIPWGLVTAAGVYGPIGPFLENPWSEWKQALEINLYGSILAMKFFAQKLIAQKLPGRIVALSGGGATQALPNFTSYCATKAAIVRFSETLAHELKPHHITLNSIAPGAVNTQLTDDLIKAGPKKAGTDMYAKALKQKEEGGTSPDKAADLAVYLVSEPAGAVTGRLLSAVWDPWPTLHTNKDVLNHKDMYTLKRLVPEGLPGVKKN